MDQKTGVVSRSALRKGIKFEDIGMLRWEDSWIENEEVRFNIDEPACTECNKPIKDKLYIFGSRMAYDDAPVPVSGSDKVHFACSSGYKDKNPETYLKDSKTNVKDVSGFYSLSREDKIARFKECDQKYDESDLESDNLAFSGFRFYLSGKFSEQPKIEDTIVKAGGQVVTQTQDVTHIVLGSSGRKFKNVWGEGSPAHKAALKHEPEVVSEDWLDTKVKEAKDKAADWKKYKEDFLATWNKKKAERDEKKSAASKKRADTKAAKAAKTKAKSDEPKPTRSTRKRKPSAKAEQGDGDDEDDEDEDDEDEKPKKRRGRKKASD